MYLDLTWLGYGVGLVLGFWFFGLVVSIVFGILKRIGYLGILFCVYFLYLYSGLVSAADFIQLPAGIDWISVFSDIVTLITPLVVFFVGFGAYSMVKRVLSKVGNK